MQQGLLQPLNPVTASTQVSQACPKQAQVREAHWRIRHHLGLRPRVRTEGSARTLHVTFKPESAYLIVGGTNGSDPAVWLAERGARTIVFPEVLNLVTGVVNPS